MANKKVRLVVRMADNTYRPILWFNGYKKDEFIWGTYGFRNEETTLRGEWNDRHTVYDSKRVQRYRLATCRELMIPFDHFSSHVDGTFHVKCKDAHGPIYSHSTKKAVGIGEDEPVFVEATVLTDSIDSYRQTELRPTDGVIQAPPEGFMKIFFAVAGRKHSYSDLMDEYRRPDQYVGPKFDFGSFQFQSIISHQSSTDRPDRGAGTVVSLRFEMTSKLWLLKAFLLA